MKIKKLRMISYIIFRIDKILYIFISLSLFSSCSYFTDLLKPELKQEKHDFILFDPYLSTLVSKDVLNSNWCFELRQGFRAIENWRFCFKEKSKANRCFQKISRLQKNIRKKGSSKELYRPGEIVSIKYIRLRENYLKKEIHPLRCLAFRTGEKHLIKNEKGSENWRKN